LLLAGRAKTSKATISESNFPSSCKFRGFKLSFRRREGGRKRFFFLTHKKKGSSMPGRNISVDGLHQRPSFISGSHFPTSTPYFEFVDFNIRSLSLLPVFFLFFFLSFKRRGEGESHSQFNSFPLTYKKENKARRCT
jgi:hypothetical protein